MTGRRVVFCALEYEAAQLRRALSRAPEIPIFVIGPAAKRLPKACELSGCNQIILAGLAGGLDPALRCGDVIVDAAADLSPGPWRRGKIQASGAIVATPAQKRDLFASTSALAVDMESDKVRDLAREVGASLIVVRAISDAADDALDPAIMSLVDSAGRLRPGSLLRLLLHRPAAVVSLLRLQKRSAGAMRSLARALEELLSVPLSDGSHPAPPAAAARDARR